MHLAQGRSSPEPVRLEDVETEQLTACQMCSLASMTSPSCLFPPWSRRIFVAGFAIRSTSYRAIALSLDLVFDSDNGSHFTLVL